MNTIHRRSYVHEQIRRRTRHAAATPATPRTLGHDVSRRRASGRPRWRRLVVAGTAGLLAVVTVTFGSGFVQPAGPLAGSPVAAQLSGQKRLYSVAETPRLHLKLEQAKPLTIFWTPKVYAASTPKAEVTYNGHAVSVPTRITATNDGYDVEVLDKGRIKAGKYVVNITGTSDSGAAYTATETFAWGVLAVNTTRDSYKPGETAHIHMGVLSATGHTLCNAPLKLAITSPAGAATDVPVTPSAVCNGDTYVDEPDYTASYLLAAAGTYKLKLQMADSDYVMEESIRVAADQPFVVERQTATRLYPPAEYASTVTLTASRDFTGTVTERLPQGFQVIDGGSAAVTGQGTAPQLAWNVSLVGGSRQTFTYTYRAPLVSPAFYTVMPLQLRSSDTVVFTENRSWQLAGDAVISFVKETETDVNVTNTTSTATVNSTAGNTLILVMQVSTTTTAYLSDVTDSSSGTWTKPPASQTQNQNPPVAWTSGGNNYYAMAYIKNAAATTDVTVTLSATKRFAYNIVEFTNIDTTAPVDVSASAGNATNTSQTSPAVTTTNADDLIIAGMSSNGSTFTLNQAGFTALAAMTANSGSSTGAAAYRVVAATGTYSVNWSLSGGVHQAVGTGTMAFKATAGCTPTNDQLMRGGQAIIGGIDCGFFWAS